MAMEKTQEKRATVLVQPRSALAARPRLFAALEQAFPIMCRPWTTEEVDAAALIVIAEDGRLPSAQALADHHLPAFAVAGDTALGTESKEFRLLAIPAVDPRVRGSVLADRLAGRRLDPVDDSDNVLAVAGSDPVWTVARGPHPVHRVRSALPELAQDEVLYSLLSKRALGSVALTHFLRSVCADAGWQPPPLRATIHFDDPNLRRRSYGFLDYRRLLAHADLHNYHAAMAMIPLDAGQPHPRAVELYARRPDRLSLIFHGNDHVRSELLAPNDDAHALAVAAQALRRINRFERRSGLRVDHVMTAPHNLCSEHMARALGALGFDALAAIHPQPWTEQFPTSPLLAAWRPADFVAGCAVIPRIPLSSSAADIALRAFLDHPLVIYSHHEDLVNGLEPLAETARMVNRLGDVQWTSLGNIARSNMLARVVDGCTTVAPFSRRLLLSGERTARLSVLAPQESLGEAELVGWSIGGEAMQPFGADTPYSQDGPREIRLHGASDRDLIRVIAPAWRPWPKLRRLATETRDRTLPARMNRRRSWRRAEPARPS